MSHPSEPLQAAPHWVYTSGAGWHDATGQVTMGRVLDPSAFVHGYEQGAYALGRHLNSILEAHEGRETGIVEALRILRRYHSGAAHPVRGWEHEPKRS